MDFPVTWDFTAWYASASAVAIGTVLLVLAFGFYAAMGGRGPTALFVPARTD
jgi:hypothetical protein